MGGYVCIDYLSHFSVKINKAQYLICACILYFFQYKQQGKLP